MRILNSDKQHLLSGSSFAGEHETVVPKKISGLVMSIVDGNTFEISVNGNNGSSLQSEKHIELIRIHGMDKPAISTLSGILAKLELEKMIVGRTVECEIIDKDELDRLIAVIPNRYFRSS